MRLQLLLGALLLSSCVSTQAPAGSIQHSVFFELTDPAHATDLVQACHDKLSPIPGILTLHTGLREPSQTGDVNDQSFHVALTVVFESVAALEAYLVDPLHLEFVDEELAGFARVVVFDSELSVPR